MYTKYKGYHPTHSSMRGRLYEKRVFDNSLIDQTHVFAGDLEDPIKYLKPKLPENALKPMIYTNYIGAHQDSSFNHRDITADSYSARELELSSYPDGLGRAETQKSILKDEESQAYNEEINYINNLIDYHEKTIREGDLTDEEERQSKNYIIQLENKLESLYKKRNPQYIIEKRMNQMVQLLSESMERDLPSLRERKGGPAIVYGGERRISPSKRIGKEMPPSEYKPKVVPRGEEKEEEKYEEIDPLLSLRGKYDTTMEVDEIVRDIEDIVFSGIDLTSREFNLLKGDVEAFKRSETTQEELLNRINEVRNDVNGRLVIELLGGETTTEVKEEEPPVELEEILLTEEEEKKREEEEKAELDKKKDEANQRLNLLDLDIETAIAKGVNVEQLTRLKQELNDARTRARVQFNIDNDYKNYVDGLQGTYAVYLADFNEIKEGKAVEEEKKKEEEIKSKTFPNYTVANDAIRTYNYTVNTSGTRGINMMIGDTLDEPPSIDRNMKIALMAIAKYYEEDDDVFTLTQNDYEKLLKWSSQPNKKGDSIVARREPPKASLERILQ